MADDEMLGSTAEKATPPESLAAATNAAELLTAKIAYSGWEHSIAQKKSFYVRGATWFYNNVLSPISDIQKRPSEDFDAIFKRLPSFRTPGLGWDETFSPRQAMAALSLRNRQPIRFHKAVQTILLCDQIVNERVASGLLNIAADEALRRMRIEPAVFYVQDFDSEQLMEFKRIEPQILERLRAETGQRTRVVFGEIASGHTVTKALAEKTRAALMKFFPGTEIGSVDSRHRSGNNMAAAPSEALAD